MASTQDKINRARHRRLADGASSIESYMRRTANLVNTAIDDIWGGANLTTVLAALERDVLAVFKERDTRLVSDVRNSYGASRGEAAWKTDELLGYKTGTGSVTRSERRWARNQAHDLVTDARTMNVRRRAQWKRIKDEIVESDRIGRTTEFTKNKVGRVLGTRDQSGNARRAQIAQLRKGNMVRLNGISYQEYRVLRTEMHRQNSLAEVQNMQRARKEGADVRLRKRGVDDGRTRDQSRSMFTEDGGKGQLSDPDGRFLYPDRRRYMMGTQPARWAINDRGYTVQDVVGTTKELEKNVDDYQANGGRKKWRSYREWARDNGIEEDIFQSPYQWP